MEQVPNQSEQIAFLSSLAKGALNRLEALPSPVVRVCGPLTSGGFGYEENLRRFKIAERVLRERGYTVFDYFDSSDDEERIQEANIPWEMVMEYYHAPILQADLLQAAFFMPGWEASNGASFEHAYLLEHTHAEIKELPEEWLTT